MKFLTSAALSRLVGVSISTLHRWESWDGMWCTIYGHRIRVYYSGIGKGTHRRYSEAEVMRLLRSLDGRPAKES